MKNIMKWIISLKPTSLIKPNKNNENYSLQNNINFNNSPEPERENEKQHVSEFNRNFIPIVCTITKKKSKYDKIDVEKHKT